MSAAETSKWQQISEVYSCECAALSMKPNTFVVQLLHRRMQEANITKGIYSLDFSSTLLGKKGVLPLLTVLSLCPNLEQVNFTQTGINDFGCVALCRIMAQHPSMMVLNLKGNPITAESLPALKYVARAWCARTGVFSATNKKRFADETDFQILLDEGPGMFAASVSELRNVRRSSEMMKEEIKTNPFSSFAALDGGADCTQPPPQTIPARHKRYLPKFAIEHARIQRRLAQTTVLSSNLQRKLKFNQDRFLTLGVYFSSRFTEFPDEMRQIHDVVFPRLNQRLRKDRLQLVPMCFHTMEDEPFRHQSLFGIDGPRPIDENRLPPWRKGHAQRLEEATGVKNNVFLNEECALNSQVRELAIRSGCDIFVALHSDMYSPVVHDVDYNCVKGLSESVPIFAYHRNVYNVPLGLAHQFEYPNAVQCELATMNHNIHSQSFDAVKGFDVQQKRQKAVDESLEFYRRIEREVPDVFRHCYPATYSRVETDGMVRFNVDDSFSRTLMADLYCASMAYLGKRWSGISAAATVISNYEGFEMPSIARQNWMEDTGVANPFNTPQYRVKDKDCAVVFVKDIAPFVFPGADQPENPDVNKTWSCILGPKGSGRTTQLRSMLAATHKEFGITCTIVSHSVIHGRRTLESLLVGLLRQLLFVKPHEFNGSVFDCFPGDDEEELVAAFCRALKSSQNIPRFAKVLVLAIDDDDALVNGKSFSDVFLCSKERMRMLRESMPIAGMRLRVYYTSTQRPTPAESDVAVYNVPTFNEIEAADLFVSFAIGIERVSNALLGFTKRTAQYLVLQKKHGLRPLYLSLAAKEVSFYNEYTTMSSIAEAMPHNVEELVLTATKLVLPKDLNTCFEALVSMPEPFDGSMLRYAVFPHRPEPHFSNAAARRTWYSARSWGNFMNPNRSAAQLLMIFLANFVHLFRFCSRNRNRGYVTMHSSHTDANVWRTPWTFASRTVVEALERRPSKRELAANPSLTKAPDGNVWECALNRLSVVRGSVHYYRANANTFNAFNFFSSPHRFFSMLDGKKIDDLRLLIEQFYVQLLVHATNDPENRSRSSKNIVEAINQSHAIAALKGGHRTALHIVNEYVRYLCDNYKVLLRHRTFVYSCPQYAPLLIREDLNQAIHFYPCAHLRYEHSLHFSEKCRETALMLTSQPQRQSAVSISKETPSMLAETRHLGGPQRPTSGPIVQTFLKSSVVSRNFVLAWRSIGNAKPHEITQAMATEKAMMSYDDDATGSKLAFGFLSAVILLEETNKYREASPSQSSTFLSVKAHANAISAVELIETRYATRIASAAYYENEVAVSALVVSLKTPSASRMQLVAKLPIEHISKPMLTSLSMSAINRAHVTDVGDDGQRAPMVCFSVKNYLHVFEGERYGHDNLYNKKLTAGMHTFTGHDSKIVLHGFSPAGIKIFTVDASGKCFVWGSPESAVSGTIMAVTDFGVVPSFARFIDQELILYCTNRAILLWNSSTSQVTNLLHNPTRTPFEHNFQMLHYCPPSYVFASHDDAEIVSCPPNTRMFRLLEQLREKKYPTVLSSSFDGVVVLDAGERSIKLFRRQHFFPKTEADCDVPPKLVFGTEPVEVCSIPLHVSRSDDIGNQNIEKWKWCLGAKIAVAIDTNENMIKAFDLIKGQQVPLFFAIARSVDELSLTSLSSKKDEHGRIILGTVFSDLDDVATCGAQDDKLVVAQSNGALHVVTLVHGAMLYPTPALSELVDGSVALVEDEL